MKHENLTDKKQNFERAIQTQQEENLRPKRKKTYLDKRRIASVFLFIIGLSILVYPYIAQYINKLNATQLVESYFANQAASGIPNAQTSEGTESFFGSTNEAAEHIFGSIYIPKLDLELPIYTGTTTANLSKGIAHLEGTSLPVGGKNTHSVLCGHTRAATNEWFTNIDKMTEGDLFYIRTLEQLLTYKVIAMKVIEPDNTSELLIVPEKDYVTLLTCTKSGNQRLIVTGERVLSESWTEPL